MQDESVHPVVHGRSRADERERYVILFTPGGDAAARTKQKDNGESRFQFEFKTPEFANMNAAHVSRGSMATLAGCLAMSHGPQLMLDPDHWNLFGTRAGERLSEKLEPQPAD